MLSFLPAVLVTGFVLPANLSSNVLLKRYNLPSSLVRISVSKALLAQQVPFEGSV